MSPASGSVAGRASQAMHLCTCCMTGWGKTPASFVEARVYPCRVASTSFSFSCGKLPPMHWLKSTHSFYFTVFEQSHANHAGFKPRCQQSSTPRWILKGKLHFLAISSCWWLSAFLPLWPFPSSKPAAVAKCSHIIPNFCLPCVLRTLGMIMALHAKSKIMPVKSQLLSDVDFSSSLNTATACNAFVGDEAGREHCCACHGFLDQRGRRKGERKSRRERQ